MNRESAMQLNVLEYFESTCRRIPDRVAVRDAADALTFSDLRRRALALAAQISDRQRPVALLMPKGVHWITGLLGALYSGNFYAPIDARIPATRLHGMLLKLCPIAVVTTHATTALAKSMGIREDAIFEIGAALPPDFAPGPAAPWTGVLDSDPAYIIHTSGSTGLPKGVVISHRAIIDYVDWAVETYRMTGAEIIANQAPYYFDNSTLDFFLCFATGATLVLIPEELFGFPARLMEHLCQVNATFIFWVPSLLVNIANFRLLEGPALPPLTKILFAGEVMPNRQLNQWRRAYPDALFSNLYGPTEITVDCTYLIVDRPFADEEPLPIGVPCRNSGVLLLEGDRLITRPGETGELCVRGTSVALGYWNDPERTAEKFVQNPLNPHYPERIYRTGDLASYNERGEILFHGRLDFQIKHLGYRIELGEIEHAVLQVPGIRNACVVYQHERKEITLFFESDSDLSPASIRERLAAFLPKYMLPTVFHRLDQLPRNPNGKIDRQELAERLA